MKGRFLGGPLHDQERELLKVGDRLVVDLNSPIPSARGTTYSVKVRRALYEGVSLTAAGHLLFMFMGYRP